MGFFWTKQNTWKISFSFLRFILLHKQSSTCLNVKRLVTRSHHSSGTPTSLVRRSEYLYFRERPELIASLFAPSFICLSELLTNSGETIIFCLLLPCAAANSALERSNLEGSGLAFARKCVAASCSFTFRALRLAGRIWTRVKSRSSRLSVPIRL